MKQVRITIVKKVEHKDLIEQFENPIEHACCHEVGQVYVSKEAEKPEGFCSSAWMNLYPFVFSLANGARDIYQGWMKDAKSAMISCNDGFRPVSFLLEVMDEED